MLEQTYLDKHYFNHQFLKFRIRYYFNETKEWMARHKLLTAFIICLLTPGVKNIQAMGVPFYVLIDPAITFKTKVIDLLALLFFLLAMTKAQLAFIKGGALREYLQTLYIPFRVHKVIDFIILLFSLNIAWLAIFFGGAGILHHAQDPLFLVSQYCLYLSTIFALCTLLLNVLYEKTVSSMIVFSALFSVIVISKQGHWLLNFGTGVSIASLCGLIIWKIKPNQNKQKYLFKIPYFNRLHDSKNFDAFKNVFIIQLAVLRQNKRSFLIRFSFCFLLSLLILQILISPETGHNWQGLTLVFMSLQTYFLSTLFTLFEKGKLEHALFHKIFPYQKYAQPIKEIILTWMGFMLLLIPVFLFCIFNLKDYFLWILIISTLNAVVFAINRIFYTQSLRFCLLSSLLNTVGSCVVQYIFLGA